MLSMHYKWAIFKFANCNKTRGYVLKHPISCSLSKALKCSLACDNSARYKHTMWPPPVISWFIYPINYSYTYHKPQLLELCSPTQLSNGGSTLYDTWGFLSLTVSVLSRSDLLCMAKLVAGEHTQGVVAMFIVPLIWDLYCFVVAKLFPNEWCFQYLACICNSIECICNSSFVYSKWVTTPVASGV